MSAWATEDAIAQLRILWADVAIGTAEIGLRLGAPKNAIVGKARRLGLPARPVPTANNRWGGGAGPKSVRPEMTPPPVRAATLPPPVDSPRPAIVAPLPPMPTPVAPAVFRSEACAWPIGDPHTREFRYCDAAAAQLTPPYCAEHTRLAYARHTPREGGFVLEERHAGSQRGPLASAVAGGR